MKVLNPQTGEVLYLIPYPPPAKGPPRPKRVINHGALRAIEHLSWMVGGLVLALIVVSVAWH